ncbi:hypothetical protein [Escherichia phage PH1062]|nr:hypothetical protein [Escherichia phage PH1062]
MVYCALLEVRFDVISALVVILFHQEAVRLFTSHPVLYVLTIPAFFTSVLTFRAIQYLHCFFEEPGQTLLPEKVSRSLPVRK